MRLRHAVLAWFALVSVTSVHADNNTCAGAVFVVPDGSTHEGDLSGPGARWYRFVAKAGRSYAIMLENLTAGDEQAEIGVVGLFDACGGALIAANATADFQEPVGTRGTGFGEIGVAAGATRQALRTTMNGEIFVQIIDLNTTSPAHFRVRVEETTIFSPMWSTEAGFATHYRFYNTTNRACTVTIEARTDSNGVPLGGPNAATFNLAANSSVSRHIGPGDLALQAGQIGHATITHDCVPGAIQADAFLSDHLGLRILPLKIGNARQQR